MAYRDETVIIDRGSDSTGGVIAAVVIVALVVLGFFLFANGNFGGSRTIDVDVPAVTVGVTPDGQ